MCRKQINQILLDWNCQEKCYKWVPFEYPWIKYTPLAEEIILTIFGCCTIRDAIKHFWTKKKIERISIFKATNKWKELWKFFWNEQMGCFNFFACWQFCFEQNSSNNKIHLIIHQIDTKTFKSVVMKSHTFLIEQIFFNRNQSVFYWWIWFITIVEINFEFGAFPHFNTAKLDAFNVKWLCFDSSNTRNVLSSGGDISLAKNAC